MRECFRSLPKSKYCNTTEPQTCTLGLQVLNCHQLDGVVFAHSTSSTGILTATCGEPHPLYRHKPWKEGPILILGGYGKPHEHASNSCQTIQIPSFCDPTALSCWRWRNLRNQPTSAANQELPNPAMPTKLHEISCGQCVPWPSIHLTQLCRIRELFTISTIHFG